MPNAARLTDLSRCPEDVHHCKGCPHDTLGPAINGSPNVLINHLNALRIGDDGIHKQRLCCGPNTWECAEGSRTVFTNHIPAVRLGDKTDHCGGEGKIVTASNNVIIGG